MFQKAVRLIWNKKKDNKSQKLLDKYSLILKHIVNLLPSSVWHCFHLDFQEGGDEILPWPVTRDPHAHLNISKTKLYHVMENIMASV